MTNIRACIVTCANLWRRARLLVTNEDVTVPWTRFFPYFGQLK